MAADVDFDARSGTYSDAGSTPAADGATVQQWNSALGGYTGSQATSGNRPTYHTTGGPANGKYLQFDGSNDRLAITYDGEPGAGLFLLRPDTIGSYRGFYGADTSDAVAVGSFYFQFDNTSHAAAIRSTSNDGGSATDLKAAGPAWGDVWMCFGWRRNGSTIYLYRNGVLVSSDSYTPGSLRPITAGSQRIGCEWYGDSEVDFFQGGIARAMIWTSDPGEAALQAAAATILSDHGISELSSPAYFFPTFTSNQEALYLLASSDGIAWVNHACTYVPNGSNTFRDGSMWDDGAGTYWIVHTTGSFGTSSSFAIAKSVDSGRTWSHVANVDMSAVSGANRVWAPEPLRNLDNTIYLSGGYPVITVAVSTDAASTFTFYNVSPTNAGYTTWGSPTAVTGTSLPNCIDFFGMYEPASGEFHALVKKDPSSIVAGNIQRWKTTTSPTAGWTVQQATAPASMPTGIEGPSVINLGATLRAYADTGSGLYYYAGDTADFDTVTWASGTLVTHPLQNSQTPRHGSIMAPAAAPAGSAITYNLYAGAVPGRTVWELY